MTAKVTDLFSSLDELRAFNMSHRVADRCGYESAKEMWQANPEVVVKVNLGTCELAIDEFTRGYLDAAKEGGDFEIDPPSLRTAIKECKQVQAIKNDSSYLGGAEFWRANQRVFVGTGTRAFII